MIRRHPRARVDASAAAGIPYVAHVTDSVVRTAAGDLVFAFELAGRPFECADDATLAQWHEHLNLLWRNIAAPGVALWTHLVRRSAIGAPLPQSDRLAGFARHLARRIDAQASAQPAFTNTLYVSVVLRPTVPAAAARTGRLARAAAPDLARLERDTLEQAERLQAQLAVALAEARPRLLRVEREERVLRSRLLEFFALLVNGRSEPIPVPRGPISDILATGRLFVGREALEYRGLSDTQVGAVLGIKEYPQQTRWDQLDALLVAPFAFVLTQSFTFLAKATAQGLIVAQRNRLANAGDHARSQAAALDEALDALAGNAFVLGDHHLSLHVLAPLADDTPDTSGRMNPRRLARLDADLAAARELLSDAGMVVAREDLALEAAYWAQLPGAFAARPRRAPITSRNFAALAPLHGFPSGREHQHHWGAPVLELRTRAATPYALGLHAPRVADGSDAGSDTGHTFVCGPTGSGKTVLLGTMIAMLQRLEATQIVLDRDRGLEILVRALGGQYLVLAAGRPTGCNPLQLEPTPANRQFLRQWLALLAGGPTPLSAADLQELDEALAATLALPRPLRTLSHLAEHLDVTRSDGPWARLSPWCTACDGENAWAFDAGDDAVVPLLAGQALVGFDLTAVLEVPALRAPIAMYLLHLVQGLLDGRRLVCWCDEFWRLLDDVAFSAFARDGLKTWRKLNGVFVACTQSASDVLASPIARTIVEQTATRIFFPNARARRDDHLDGFALTEREWTLVRDELTPGSRAFLVSQAGRSVVCRLGLDGMDAELAVISGRRASLDRLEALMRTHGTDPADWVPAFLGQVQTHPVEAHR